MADAQLGSGAFTDTAPRLRGFDRTGAPAWADAGVIVPSTLYTMYGDRGIVQRHFASMTAWMNYLERANPDYLRARGLGTSYNDWAAARELADAIRRADWYLTTGFVGVGNLLPVLSSHGYDSTAYRLLEQRSRPSWRYMIENGATTIWERWDG